MLSFNPNSILNALCMSRDLHRHKSPYIEGTLQYSRRA
nr:MAG TPA: hypothetical protein [Caudoviricetes sp.]